MKSSSFKQRDKFVFKLSRTRMNATSYRREIYNEEDCDYFFLFSLDGRCWLIPYEKMEAKISIVPEDKYSEFEIKINN